MNCYKVNFHGILRYTSHFWEATTAKRMKIGPYYQRQKCSPMTSFRKYKAYADIREGFPGRGCQMAVGLSTTVIFLAIWVATSLETSEIRPAVLQGDTLPLVGQ